MQLDHVSASQIDKFRKCPRQWLLSQTCYPEPTNVNMASGSMFHNNAANILLTGEDLPTPYSQGDIGGLSDGEVAEAYDASLQFLNQWRKHTYASITPMTQVQRSGGIPMKLIEWPFRFFVEGISVAIEGRIDLLDANYGLVDWKTTSLRNAETWAKYTGPQRAIQPYLYGLWYLHNIDPCAVATQFQFCVVFPTGKPAWVNASKTVEELGWFVNNQLAPTVSQMLNGPYPASGDEKACSWCYYKEQCRA